MRKICFLAFTLLALLPACSLPVLAAPTATPTLVPPTATPLPPTVTLTPTPTESPTPTLEPTAAPTIMPTIDPLIGVALAPTNIRSGPGKGGNERIGGLFFNESVKVIGRNDTANWLYIIFNDSPTGTGWVLASAIELRGDLTELPILIYPDKSSPPVMYPPLIYRITGTPQPLNLPLIDSKTGTIVQVTNVRVGPSIGHMVIGILKPGEVVILTGRVVDNYWVQIQYPSGLDGRAWISTSLLKPKDGYGGLPYYNLLATPITPDTSGPATKSPAQKTQAAQNTPRPTKTPRPTTTPSPTLSPTSVIPTLEGPTGHTKIQINVRAGPMQNSPALGVLNAGELVLITGRNLIGNWLQIEYPPESASHGWVATDYIDLSGVKIDKLPLYDNQGTPLP